MDDAPRREKQALLSVREIGACMADPRAQGCDFAAGGRRGGAAWLRMARARPPLRVISGLLRPARSSVEFDRRPSRLGAGVGARRDP
jgi:hypothetical protein